ncbi:MAG: Crotonyl-CoA hydratase [Phycisphaerae bacterium]|nr:Crotonyl-CoA hydratase [Phycisphaerae bacterium]
MAEHTQAVLEPVSAERADIIFRTENGLNVASVEFLRSLEVVLDQLAEQEAVRYLCLRAEGKVYLAGANIKAMAGYNPNEARAMAEFGHRVLNKLEQLPAITVAAIHGVALGGGCELAMACDFRYAVKSVTIGQPEVLLGLIPGWGGTIRLPKLVPLGWARKLIYTGEAIKADLAQQIGLVDEIVNSAEDLEPLIRSLFSKLAKAGPAAINGAKTALLTDNEIPQFAECFTRKEAKEGMKAFLEKRPAPWINPE